MALLLMRFISSPWMFVCLLLNDANKARVWIEFGMEVAYFGLKQATFEKKFGIKLLFLLGKTRAQLVKHYYESQLIEILAGRMRYSSPCKTLVLLLNDYKTLMI